MFIIKWWRFLQGYLVVTVRGRGVERLLNLAITRGVQFADLKKSRDQARFSIALKQFRMLRPLVRASRCRLHIERKVGFPFLMYRLRRRRGLALGAVFFCLVLYLATSFVWFVRVTGVNRLSQGEILKLAEELDLRPGVWKRRLNLPELEEEMVRRHRGIAWAGLRVKGIVLEIEIVEHIPPVEQDPAPADLVAAKDGLIQRVVVVEGEAVVSAGDTVSQGDLLIRGEKPLAFPEEGEEPPLKEKVRARGEVWARVWYESRVPVEEKIRRLVPGEESRQSFFLVWKGRRLRLWGPKEDPYPHSREELRQWTWKWRNLTLPVEFTKITYREMKLEEQIFSPGEALERARRLGKEQVLKQIPAGVAPEQIFVEEEREGGQLWLRTVAETVENIAQVKLHRRQR
ncbi:MAG: sporulation protein YqfD [Dethiobacteria bacterium]|nr:sporulation protein YqfD [Bacillota bacterium]HOP69456.1 sporulation protein YqfD [Bacillota bacterium]HPT34438.1 sporulation protein YqfD [Bacillota bacterium]HQD06424.1 sporulation protein YqfD [Bacillota bacterium]